MLDVVRLRVLLAVSRTGSLTAAARTLHYSQPSVSHHLAKLEAETGANLIQRVGRGIRLTHLLDDPSYLVSPPPADGAPAPADAVADLRDHAEDGWIAGCDRCRTHLLDMCAQVGYEPRISFTSDDIVAVQALVAAGIGLTVLPGLALRAHRNPAVQVAEIPGSTRHVYAAVYGDPPDPPSTTALLN